MSRWFKQLVAKEIRKAILEDNDDNVENEGTERMDTSVQNQLLSYQEQLSSMQKLQETSTRQMLELQIQNNKGRVHKTNTGKSLVFCQTGGISEGSKMPNLYLRS